MATARETVRLGLAARGQAKVKVRQPLHEAVVVAAGAERAAIERLADVVRDELNVRTLRFVDQADELGTYEVKPNYRALGPRFGKAMPQVAQAVAALDPAHVAAAAARRRARSASHVEGHEHELGPEDLLLVLQPLDGYQLEREGSHAVALELALDEALRREGLAREAVHAVQGARKAAGLAVEDRIVLALGGDDELLAAAREHEAYAGPRGPGDSRSTSTGARRGRRGDDRGSRAADRRRARLARPAPRRRAPRRRARRPRPCRPAARGGPGPRGRPGRPRRRGPRRRGAGARRRGRRGRSRRSSRRS